MECEICKKEVPKTYKAAGPDRRARLCRDCLIRWLTGAGEADKVEPVICFFCQQPTTVTFSWEKDNTVYKMCPACMMDRGGRAGRTSKGGQASG